MTPNTEWEELETKVDISPLSLRGVPEVTEVTGLVHMSVYSVLVYPVRSRDLILPPSRLYSNLSQQINSLLGTNQEYFTITIIVIFRYFGL